jgi:hypothetical protein
MNYRINFTDLNNTLVSYAEGLLPRLLPHGSFEGSEYVALNPTRYDKHPGSFRINRRNIVWCDFATGEKGRGFISLYCYLNGVKPTQAALDLANSVNIALPEQEGNAKAAKRHADYHNYSAAKDADHTRLINKLWQSSGVAHGTVVHRYLHNRGIDGHIPSAIRYLPDHLHRPGGIRLPCMLAAITRWGEKEVTALHRTYLRLEGSNKAAVDPPKMMLGKISGGAVQLSHPTDQLVLAEGIETALSINMLATRHLRYGVWAVLSASGYANLVPPSLPFAETIIIAADNDPAGVEAARRAAIKWTKVGRRVKIALPPANKDFNDLLMEDICL